MKFIRILGAGFLSVACSPAQPATAAAPNTTIPAAGSAPTAETPEAPVPPREAPQPEEAASTCMVWRPCECNSGCVLADKPKGALEVGVAVTLIGKRMAGTRAFVVSVPSTGGGRTLVLDINDPNGPGACQREVRNPSFGYGCEQDKAGQPVDPQQCAGGCEESVESDAE